MTAKPNPDQTETWLAPELLERIAQITAHRACCGTEHDVANGKLHGCCVVCGVPWPCAYAGTPPSDAPELVRLRAVAEEQIHVDDYEERTRKYYDPLINGHSRLKPGAVVPLPDEAYHRRVVALAMFAAGFGAGIVIGFVAAGLWRHTWIS